MDYRKVCADISLCNSISQNDNRLNGPGNWKLLGKFKQNCITNNHSLLIEKDLSEFHNFHHFQAVGSTVCPKISRIQEIQCLILQIQNLGKTIALQWIPAHSGISGNERADILAKKGLKNPRSVFHMNQ